MTDGSQMYYMDKRYLAEHDMEYLSGSSELHGFRYDFNSKKIIDSHVKGEVSLEYKLVK